MLRDSACVVEGEGDGVSAWGDDGARAWEQIDRSLRRIATKRAALDAEEARWLREAERVRIWEPLGMVNMIDYLERVLGYAPRTGQQRMQVARALASLPAMTEALAVGELSFSAVRELVRVATPSTEEAWRAHVGGMNLRQIEEAVAGRKPGDVPTDPPQPELRTHTVTLELSDPVFALWRQAGLALAEQLAHRLDDDELGTALATRSWSVVPPMARATIAAVRRTRSR